MGEKTTYAILIVIAVVLGGIQVARSVNFFASLDPAVLRSSVIFLLGFFAFMTIVLNDISRNRK